MTSPLSSPPKPMEHVVYQVKKFIVGQDELLERLIVALLARGHVLVEGVPGLAKTMAIKTLAQSIGGEFQRRVIRHAAPAPAPHSAMQPGRCLNHPHCHA